MKSRRPRRRRPAKPPQQPARNAATIRQEHEDAARAAGLRYAFDDAPGITRKKRGAKWQYFDAAGARIVDDDVIARCNKLAIPPAWTSVWICPDKDGHIQATGRDARGRKQYRYHPQFRATRDETKFERMVAFARALPALRETVAKDLRRRGLPKNKALATVIRLLETTLIRVGNEEYARQNNSYGLTTMLSRHVAVTGRRLRFSFKGKSNKHHDIVVEDPSLARLVKQMRALPGKELVQYVDDAGVVRALDSDDVNAYIRAVAGGDFSAKDFRTWAGTVLAAGALLGLEKPTKKAINDAIRGVSEKLGNTLTVCRKSYVHPGVFAGHSDGTLQAAFVEVCETTVGLSDAEARVLAYLAAVQDRPKPTLEEQLQQSLAQLPASPAKTKKRKKAKTQAKKKKKAKKKTKTEATPTEATEATPTEATPTEATPMEATEATPTEATPTEATPEPTAPTVASIAPPEPEPEPEPQKWVA